MYSAEVGAINVSLTSKWWIFRDVFVAAIVGDLEVVIANL